MEVKDEKKSPYPVINQIECKACGRCIVSCPKDCLEMSKDVNQRGYHYVVYKGTGCTGCANCFYSCPEPNGIEVHIPKKD